VVISGMAVALADTQMAQTVSPKLGKEIAAMGTTDPANSISVTDALNTLHKAGVRPCYGNFIGGQWVLPAKGRYTIHSSPINHEPLCEIARSSAEDVDKALEAAHAAKQAWSRTAAAVRASILNRIAERMTQNFELLALAEALDTNKPIGEIRDVDVPLSINHFHHFANRIRGPERAPGEPDFAESLSTDGHVISLNFPLLVAAWKMAPALAAGNCTVLKPPSGTPFSLLVLVDLIGDLLPPGVVNVVTGSGSKVGKALTSSPHAGKTMFAGETTHGHFTIKFIAETVVPANRSLHGRSHSGWHANVLYADDDLFDKALEGFALACVEQTQKAHASFLPFAPGTDLRRFSGVRSRPQPPEAKSATA
jgi:aldehyde dehydrogenase